jgi:hypothetical protein
MLFVILHQDKHMTLKPKLIGAFDLLMLFGRGIEAFSGKRREALWSFVIPVAMFFVSLPFSYAYPPKGMESGFSHSRILMTVTLQNLLSTVMAYALIIVVAYSLKKLDRFWLFVEANNWITIATVAVSVPFAVAAVLGWVPREEMDRILVLLQCYFYVVTACIFFRAFRVNWQLAGFLAILTFFANQVTWDFLYRVQGITLPW